MNPATLCTALLTLTLTGYAFGDINISQSDADSKTTYQTTGSSQTYQLTESVTFQGYEETRGYGVSNGMIFWSNRSNVPHTVTMQGDGQAALDLIFDSNNLFYEGTTDTYASTTGGAFHACYATFKDLDTVQFSNNKHYNEILGDNENSRVTYGGSFGIYDMILDNVKEFVVTGNTASGRDMVVGGGGFFEGITTGASGTGNITVTNNKILLQVLGTYGMGGGIGNNDGGSSDEFYNAGHITFANNTITYADVIADTKTYATQMQGGALKDTNAKFKNTLNIRFTDNLIDGSTQDHDVKAYGGGISTASAQFMGITSEDSNPAVLFSGNRVLRNHNQSGSLAAGGAIDAWLLLVEGSGDVLFENNSATDKGGAVYLNMSSTGYTSYLYADNGDITFKGNTDSLGASNERNTGIANAIHAAVRSGKQMGVDLNANEGRSIYFYDRITSASVNKDEFTININNDSDEKYQGTVVFSGKHVKDTLRGSEATADYDARVEASKRSDVNATINLIAGKLRLEEGVTLGRRYDAANDAAGTGALFSMTGGILDISGTELNGASVLGANLIEIRGGVIMAGDKAAFVANDIDFSQGVTFDLAYYIEGNTMHDLAGLQLNAETLTLGGMLTIADTTGSYYDNAFWGEDRAFVLFDSSLVTGSLMGNFDGIQSALAGGDTIGSTHAFEGVWSSGWEGDKFVAYWTTLSPIPEPASSGLALAGLALFTLARRRKQH